VEAIIAPLYALFHSIRRSLSKSNGGRPQRAPLTLIS